MDNMHLSTRIGEYRSLVNNAIFDALAPHTATRHTTDVPHIEEFVGPARTLLRGGKRTRAIMVAAGFEVAHLETRSPMDQWPIHAGVALELYQGSALVHDDIIDDAETRRGQVATHHQYANIHKRHQLQGNSRDFGEKSAILLGDYLLSLSCVEMQQAEHVSTEALLRAFHTFHLMTAEVAYGQYLDMRAEFTPLGDSIKDFDRDVRSAFDVVFYKSARYSVELPAQIGAELGGGSAELLEALRSITRPLGEAFQLHDDYLGIFGDSHATGKPVGGDITEGKRTVLLALARRYASSADKEFLDSSLGVPLSENELRRIQDIIRECGALKIYGNLISEREREAKEALHTLEHLIGAPAYILPQIATMLTNRKS